MLDCLSMKVAYTPEIIRKNSNTESGKQKKRLRFKTFMLLVDVQRLAFFKSKD